MLLCCGFESVSAWFSLFANIATVLGVVLVVIAVVPIILNRLSKRTFHIKLKMRFRAIYDAGIDEIVCDILFINFTDKCFHITKCAFIVDGKEYAVHGVDKTNHCAPTTELKNISISPYQAFETIGAVLLPDNSPLALRAKIKVETTRKTITYKAEIELPEDYKSELT